LPIQEESSSFSAILSLGLKIGVISGVFSLFILVSLSLPKAIIPKEIALFVRELNELFAKYSLALKFSSILSSVYFSNLAREYGENRYLKRSKATPVWIFFWICSGGFIGWLPGYITEFQGLKTAYYSLV
jgi:hypothetical protein